MKNTIQFAAKHTDINKNDFKVMFHARQSLLFHSSQPWFKRESDTFDVKTGACDGAEICEFEGIFKIQLLSQEYNYNIHYR